MLLGWRCRCTEGWTRLQLLCWMLMGWNTWQFSLLKHSSNHEPLVCGTAVLWNAACQSGSVMLL